VALLQAKVQVVSARGRHWIPQPSNLFRHIYWREGNIDETHCTVAWDNWWRGETFLSIPPKTLARNS